MGIKVLPVFSTPLTRPPERTLLLAPRHEACREGQQDGQTQAYFSLTARQGRQTHGEKGVRKLVFLEVFPRSASSQSRWCLDGMSVKSGATAAHLLVTPRAPNLRTLRGSFPRHPQPEEAGMIAATLDSRPHLLPRKLPGNIVLLKLLMLLLP